MEGMWGQRRVHLALSLPSLPQPHTVILAPLSSGGLTPWNLCLWPLKEKNSSTDLLPPSWPPLSLPEEQSPFKGDDAFLDSQDSRRRGYLGLLFISSALVCKAQFFSSLKISSLSEHSDAKATLV